MARVLPALLFAAALSAADIDAVIGYLQHIAHRGDAQPAKPWSVRREPGVSRLRNGDGQHFLVRLT